MVLFELTALTWYCIPLHEFTLLDKSRSLAITVMSIKATRVRLPGFAETDEKAFLRDLLTLREDPNSNYFSSAFNDPKQNCILSNWQH